MAEIPRLNGAIRALEQGKPAFTAFCPPEIGMAQAINAALPPMKIDVEGSTSCPWEPIDRIDPVAQAQTTVVELSGPFPNPFVRGEAGILVRLSVGGQYAQWYWVPLAERDGRLGIGIVMPLNLHEG